MNINLRKTITMVMIFLLLLFASSGVLIAEDAIDAVKPIVETMKQAQAGMTLWQMIQAGGIIMIVLLILSIVTVAIIVYNFMTITEAKLSPGDFSESVIKNLEKGDEKQVKKECESNDNIISRIILSGLAKRKQGAVFAKEAMENSAKKEAILIVFLIRNTSCEFDLTPLLFLPLFFYVIIQLMLHQKI